MSEYQCVSFSFLLLCVSYSRPLFSNCSLLFHSLRSSLFRFSFTFSVHSLPLPSLPCFVRFPFSFPFSQFFFSSLLVLVLLFRSTFFGYLRIVGYCVALVTINVAQKVEPFPGMLSTPTQPPIARQSCFVIARPKNRKKIRKIT